MARPYVSHKKLCDNSRAAMLAAIEIYNKPQTMYREQVVTVLVVNAWELILKAALRKAKKNIFYRKKRTEALQVIIAGALYRRHGQVSSLARNG